MERVQEYKVEDWVCILPSLTTANMAWVLLPLEALILYCIRPNSSLLLNVSCLPNSCHHEPDEVEYVELFRIGDRVCVKHSVAELTFAWGSEIHDSVGRISEIESGSLLIIEIPTQPSPWKADLADME